MLPRALPCLLLVALVSLTDSVECCRSKKDGGGSEEEEAPKQPETNKTSHFIFPDQVPTPAPPAGCQTTEGGRGRCLDVHLCRHALTDIVRRNVYPAICSYDGRTKDMIICCPDEYAQQCGVAFPDKQGFRR